jgi:hypothetical protein
MAQSLFTLIPMMKTRNDPSICAVYRPGKTMLTMDLLRVL